MDKRVSAPAYQFSLSFCIIIKMYISLILPVILVFCKQMIGARIREMIAVLDDMEGSPHHEARSSDGSKIYQCGECDFFTIAQGFLLQHQTAVHEGSDSQREGGGNERLIYECTKCDHKSTSKNDLAKHKRIVHEGLKHPCDKCDHIFTTKSHMNRHKRAVHEGVRYPCGECDVSFQAN